MKRNIGVLLALMAVLLMSACAKNERKCTCERGEKGSDTVMVLSAKSLEVNGKGKVHISVVDTDYCLHSTTKLLNYLEMDVKLKCKAMTNVDSLAFTDFVNGPLYLFFCNEDGVILDNVVPLASSYKDDAKLKEALIKGEEVTISFVGMISNNLPEGIGGFTIGYDVDGRNTHLADEFRNNCNTTSLEQVEKWDKLMDELETTYLILASLNKQTNEQNSAQLDFERSKLNEKQEQLWQELDAAVKSRALAPMQIVRMGGMHMKVRSIEQSGVH